MSYYNSTAPDSPPMSVMVTSVIPASLNVSWQQPPAEDHNGPITYVIQYSRTDGSSDPVDVNVTSGTMHTISELVAYVDYSVMVAAINVAGIGQYSNAKVGRSGENGEFKLLASYTI